MIADGEGDHEPAECEVGTQDTRRVPVDPLALPELFVPRVLERVRESVGEHQRQVRPQRAPGRRARKEERGQREHDAAVAVVEAEMHGSNALVADGWDLLAHEDVAGKVEAGLCREPGQREQEEQHGEHEPDAIAIGTTGEG